MFLLCMKQIDATQLILQSNTFSSENKNGLKDKNLVAGNEANDSLSRYGFSKSVVFISSPRYNKFILSKIHFYIHFIQIFSCKLEHSECSISINNTDINNDPSSTDCDNDDNNSGRSMLLRYEIDNNLQTI